MGRHMLGDRNSKGRESATVTAARTGAGGMGSGLLFFLASLLMVISVIRWPGVQ